MAALLILARLGFGLGVLADVAPEKSSSTSWACGRGHRRGRARRRGCRRLPRDPPPAPRGGSAARSRAIGDDLPFACGPAAAEPARGGLVPRSVAGRHRPLLGRRALDRLRRHAGGPRPAAASQRPEIPLRAGLLGLAVLVGAFAASLVVSVVLFALRLPDAVVFLGGATSRCTASWSGGAASVSRRLRHRPARRSTSASGSAGSTSPSALGTWFAATVRRGDRVRRAARPSACRSAPTPTPSRDSTDQPASFVAVALVAIVHRPDRRGAVLPRPPAAVARGRGSVPWLAVVTQGLIFGSIHLQFGLGLATSRSCWPWPPSGTVFGSSPTAVGRLGPSIVAHAIFNTIAVVAALGRLRR